MFEFLMDFEKEFKAKTGLELKFVRAIKKLFQLRMEINLVVNGKYKGVRYLCVRRGLFNKHKLIMGVRKSRMIKVLDFMVFDNGLQLFKKEFKYWQMVFKNPKYIGTAINPIVSIESNVVHWTFEV